MVTTTLERRWLSLNHFLFHTIPHILKKNFFFKLKKVEKVCAKCIELRDE